MIGFGCGSGAATRRMPPDAGSGGIVLDGHGAARRARPESHSGIPRSPARSSPANPPGSGWVRLCGAGPGSRSRAVAAGRAVSRALTASRPHGSHPCRPSALTNAERGVGAVARHPIAGARAKTSFSSGTVPARSPHRAYHGPRSIQPHDPRLNHKLSLRFTPPGCLRKRAPAPSPGNAALR